MSDQYLKRAIQLSLKTAKEDKNFLKDYMSDSSSDDSSSSEDENFTDTKTILAQAELPPDFWQVRPGKEVAFVLLTQQPWVRI